MITDVFPVTYIGVLLPSRIFFTCYFAAFTQIIPGHTSVCSLGFGLRSPACTKVVGSGLVMPIGRY